MNAFNIGQEVESRGLDALLPFLRHRSFNGQFTLTYKGALAKMLQQTVGDLLMNVANKGPDTVFSVEIKCEERNAHDNLFLETWSNRGFSPRRPGWMVTNQADFLWWYFLESDELLVFNFRSLWNWALVDPQQNTRRGAGRMYDFPEKTQGKYEQQNLTAGRCVPIGVLADEVRFKLFWPQRNGCGDGFLITSREQWLRERHQEPLPLFGGR